MTTAAPPTSAATSRAPSWSRSATATRPPRRPAAGRWRRRCPTPRPSRALCVPSIACGRQRTHSLRRRGRARDDHRRNRRAGLRPGGEAGARGHAGGHRLACRGARGRSGGSGARERVPGGTFEGVENPEAAKRAETVFLCVPFRNQAENLGNLAPVLREGQLLVDATVPLAAAVGGKATRVLGVPQGSAAQQAAEMVPEGVRVVSALHTVSAAALSDLDHELDEDVLVCGDRKADKRARGRDHRADPRAALRRRRAPGDGAHRRAADRAAHLDQRALQDPRRASASRACRTSCGRPTVVVLAGGTGGAKLARGHARRGRRRARRRRQHRRRRRGLRRPRLARPRPRHVLARRPHRRARLGPARRHLRRDGRAARAGRGRVVQPRRPRPRRVPAARARGWPRARG